MSFEALARNIEETDKVFQSIRRHGFTKANQDRLAELEREFDKLAPFVAASFEKVKLSE